MSSTTDENCLVELRVPCEVYSRIVGYLRPIQNWHAAKKQEFRDRVMFDTAKALSQEEDVEGMKKRERREEKDESN